MKNLISLILFAFATVPAAFGQSGPWQLIVDGTPSTESPLTVSNQRVNVKLSKNLEFKSEKEGSQVYDESSGRFNADLKDVLGIRFGFSYRVTPGETYAEFALFADVGTGIDPVKIGQWIEARPGVWRDVNPEVTIFAGDSVAANGVQLYFETYGGSIDVAKFDAFVEVKHSEAKVEIDSLYKMSDVSETEPQSGQLLRFDGTSYTPVNAYVTDVIWAEESGAISSNRVGFFSFGNGATGGDNFGFPIWEDMTALGMVVNAEVAGTSLVVQYRINAVTQPQTVTATGNTTVEYFSTPQQLNQGDLLNFANGLEVGNWSDVRLGLIVKKEVKFD